MGDTEGPQVSLKSALHHLYFWNLLAEPEDNALSETDLNVFNIAVAVG